LKIVCVRILERVLMIAGEVNALLMPKTFAG
jgi:hypothetical protein